MRPIHGLGDRTPWICERRPSDALQVVLHGAMCSGAWSWVGNWTLNRASITFGSKQFIDAIMITTLPFHCSCLPMPCSYLSAVGLTGLDPAFARIQRYMFKSGCLLMLYTGTGCWNSLYSPQHRPPCPVSPTSVDRFSYQRRIPTL
jgi:hypothetical protein